VSRSSQTNALPIIAGILMIIDGGFKLLGLLGVLAMGVFAIVPAEEFGMPFFSFSGVLIFLAIILALAGILILIGGIYSLQKKRWGVALAGAIVAVLPFSLLGIAALILLILSRDDFTT